MVQSKSYYQAYDNRYQQIHEQSLHWFSEEPSPIVLEIMKKYRVSKAAAILEIGCGEGRDAAYLLQNGYPVLATDVSAEAVRYCRKRFPEYADASQAFDLQKRVHHPSGREIRVAATSCRTVSFETLKAETEAGSLLLLESGMTSIIPDFPTIMYAVVKRVPA